MEKQYILNIKLYFNLKFHLFFNKLQFCLTFIKILKTKFRAIWPIKAFKINFVV